MVGEFWPLRIGKNTIGSSPKCDICLSEATVSETHTSITIRVLENQEKTIASLKDLGKKWFAFSRMEIDADALQARM